MDELYKKKCVACNGDTLPFDTTEIHKYLKKVDGWDVRNNKDKNYYLSKKFKFKNFIDSQNFINKVGNIAEAEAHHPDISFGWGYAKVKIYTHAIKGLSESDFILAAKIDKIKLMSKVTYPSKYHFNFCFVGNFNNFLISYRTTRLYNYFYPSSN